MVGIRAWYYAFCPMVPICTWYPFARGAFLRVVRIGAWCVFSPMVRILARGTYLRVVRLAAAFEDRAIGDPAAINIGSVR